MRGDATSSGLASDVRSYVSYGLLGVGRLNGPPMLIHLHAERETHTTEDFLDLVERLAAEILRLQHLGFTFCDELADRSYIGVSQTIVRANREFQFIDGFV